MSVSLIVPFRPDGAERERNWTWIRARYERLHPDWEIITDAGADGAWSKGSAVNAAVARARGDVLVIADADVVLAPDALTDAVSQLERAPWVIPHLTVYRLTDRTTQAVMEDRLALAQVRRHHLARRTFRGPNGGGVTVARRKNFVGIDERFTDWGGEDISFARAMDTLVGPHLRLAYSLWHLYHDPMPRRPRGRASEANEKLAAQYLDAAGDPVAMAQLCEQRPYEGIYGGGIVVVGKEAARSVPLDERFLGWGQEDESWAIALQCLLGPARRGHAELVHLYHPPQAERPGPNEGRYGSDANRALRCRYQFARNKPDVMRALLDEVADEPSVRTHEPALHAGPAPSVR